MRTRIFIGFFVGWITWISIWMTRDYQGGFEIFTQPILAAIFSMLFVGISYIIGVPLQKIALQPVWGRYGYASILLSIGGLACLLFPESLGLTHGAIHPETKEPFQAINIFPAAIAYLLVIFPLVNWPRRPVEDTSIKP